MVDPHTNGCPEPEVLAAYVDQGLSLSERARVDAHLTSCRRCIALLAGVARTAADLSVQLPDVDALTEATPSRTWRSVAGALAAAAAVIAVLFTPSMLRPWLDRDAGLVSLVDSVGEHRSVLGRLTGGFPHAPLDRPSAGGQDGRAAETDRVRLITGKIRESFGERLTPSQLHALGVAQLLSGRYDDAAQALLAASREQPANAQYLSDVAAVQLERARTGVRPDDLPRALAAADRARRLDPSLAEAWFNRALAASALSLRAEARTSWTEYLKRDSSSRWAAEARTRLEELSKPTPAAAWEAIEGRLQQSIDVATADEAVRTQTTEARNFIENTLIVDWANAVLADRSADVELERLRSMALAMQRVAGDAMYADAVRTIDRETAASQHKQLAEAHLDYAAAAKLFNQDAYPLLRDRFSLSQSRLKNSSFESLAALHQAAIVFILGDAARAEPLFRAVLDRSRTSGYAFVEARANWFLGLIAFGQGRFAEAQAIYEDALDGFTRMGDVEQAASIHNLLAAHYDYLGDRANAWRHRAVAFDALAVSRSPRFKAQILFTAVPSLTAENPETALAIQDAALGYARESGREGTIAEILAQRAALLAGMNQPDQAEATQREARDYLGRLPDSAFRDRVEVNLLTTESDLARGREPAVATAAATRAISLVEKRGDRLKLAQLQLRLARASLAAGRATEARTALDKGLQAFNQERAASTELKPISALDESWRLYDVAIQLSLREGDFSRAFALAEAGRARSASEFSRFANVTLDEVRSALSPAEALIVLNQFDDELAVWVIKANTVDVLSRPLSRETTAKLIARQRDDIWSNAASSPASGELYNEILRAVPLSGVSRLVIVPDQTFEDVAFAALYNTRTGKYLVEESRLATSFSAGAFVAASKAQSRPSISRPLIFDGGGNAEIARIASLYPASDLRSGTEATKERFFADALDRAIVHVNAPALGNTSYPFLSRLVVHDRPGIRHSGVILGRDIVQHPLSNTSVLVINNVAATAGYRGEGTSEFARVFTAAGVSAVVGTLPGADENATRDLMIGFHRELATGVSAEQALQTVQRKAVEQNGRRLGAWTALVLYGSDR